ncbi:hypothetical protein K505DRAFT_370894 [Melanomma pulvis-pyrius CBS 109.77]|uniref:Uncharacterized protein n=1 Tax=Melanomma pulvis-pyrius CBS 109.77 TaxID=1314802 RepID=A0A6A6XU73_9PLEO|nr:hypothetical protein K505DRAFT_370894 [Melanomma pulvis-pyrius CBS 109.77]
MDEPARKRRRTTPPDERGRQSSPLKKPPRRPSFASPTKASLARFNPNLLPSTSSTPRPDSRGQLLARGNQALQYIYSDTGDQQTLDEEGFVPKRDAQFQVSSGAEQPDVFKPQNKIPRSPAQSPTRAPTRRPKRATTPPGDLEETEAELPSTPSLRALAQQDTPRRGILFSSPIKRPLLLNDPVKHSPVKAIAQLLRGGKSARPVDVHIQVAQTLDKTERQKQPLDPELEKRKQEKARLLQELEHLQDQVTQCANEIHKSQTRSRTEAPQRSERDALIAFINQISDSDVSTKEEQAPTLSNLLCSFLPFTAHLVPPPSTKPVQQKPVSSHQPLQLEDPLPCLKFFTSLDFHSEVSFDSEENLNLSSSKLHQKHTISITDPQRLLTATVSAVVNSATTAVIHLSIQLPDWAERELGKFTHLKAQENDLSVACWAIGSYWELTKKRAEFWHKCETTFAHLIPGRTSEDTENSRPHPTGKQSQIFSRKELRRHLGRDVIILEDKYVLLKISWRVRFDWTGEAESEISISPALPRVWSEADDNNSFKKIPETFNALLERKSVFEATKIMVALLFESS